MLDAKDTSMLPSAKILKPRAARNSNHLSPIHLCNSRAAFTFFSLTAVTSDAFCRICLLKRPHLKSLMERVDGVMIPEMLYKVCGRQIEVQEGYPRSICQRCLCQLDCAFKFLNEFHQQDERLRSFYWSGSVVKRLQEYQKEGSETVEKRFAELVTRNAKMLSPPTKHMCHRETNTSQRPKLVDASTLTDKEAVVDLALVKTEDGSVVSDDLVVEDEEGVYLEYADDFDASIKDEQLVSMKIDVLQSGDEAESDAEPKERRKRAPHTATKSTPSSRWSTRTSQPLPKKQQEDSDTDDPATEEDFKELFEESEPDTVLEMDEDEEDDDFDEEDEEEDDEEDDETEEAKHMVEEQTPPLQLDPLRCYICDRNEESKTMLEQHLDMHSLMLPYECRICQVEGGPARTLKTISSLQNHFRSHHYPFGCGTCGKRFLRKAHLMTHMDSHNEEHLECGECGRQFTHRKTWQNHLKRHVAVRTGAFKCGTCGRAFGNRARLDRHVRSHTGERPFGCKYCDKRFYDRHQQQRHTERHFRDQECSCEICGETFPGAKKRDQHKVEQHLSGPELEAFLARKSRQRSYKKPAVLKDKKCPFAGCDYVANTYGAMYVHKRTKHQPVHKCELCNKSYAFLNQLRVHMALHTGEKPYQCEICGRSFRRGFSYKEHMEMHNPEASYNCPTCNKSFKRPRYLQAHVLTHTAVRKFSCEICGSCYKTNGELKKHTKNKHGLDIVEEEVREIVIDAEDTDISSFVVEYV